MNTQATAAAEFTKGQIIELKPNVTGYFELEKSGKEWIEVEVVAVYAPTKVIKEYRYKVRAANKPDGGVSAYLRASSGLLRAIAPAVEVAPAEARPNPISAVVSVNPASPYAKYNGARFSVQQVNGPVEKLVFCLNIEGTFTDFAQAELTAFWYDESAGAKPVVRVPLAAPVTELQSLSAEEMAAGLEVFTRRAGTDNTVNRLNLDNYERKQLDKLVNAGYAKPTFVAGQYELVASAGELADAEIHDLIGQVMEAQAAVTRSEAELVRVGEGSITAPAIHAALRAQRAGLKELQNRVNWIKAQRSAPTKATAPETPPAPVEAPYTLEKFYALLRNLGKLDIVPVARVPKFIRPAFLKWLNVSVPVDNVATSIYKDWAGGVLHDRELASKYIFKK